MSDTDHDGLPPVVLTRSRTRKQRYVYDCTCIRLALPSVCLQVLVWVGVWVNVNYDSFCFVPSSATSMSDQQCSSNTTSDHGCSSKRTSTTTGTNTPTAYSLHVSLLDDSDDFEVDEAIEAKRQ